MASRYPILTIGEVCDVGDGAHAKVERRDSGVLYLTSKNIGTGRLNLDKVDYISEEDYRRLFSRDSKATRRPMPGDVLIGIIGTFGNAYRYKETDHFGISSSIAILRPDQSVLHPDYLYFVTMSDSFKNSHLAIKGGSAQGYTNIPTVKTLPIPLPPLSLQRRIAGILGALDDKIEVNRHINRTLEEMAQTLYKHWFVDFGPFQDGEFVDSELGAVPAGWEVKPLSSLIEILSGGTPRTKIDEYWGGDIYWATAGDVSAGAPFIMSTERTITPLGVENSSAKILPKYTTIITARGTVGECALVPFEMSMNQSNYGIRGSDSLGDFTTYLLIKHTVQNLKKHAYGTVFDTITRKTFKAIPVARPPADVLERSESVVWPWFEEMLNNQRQNQVLAETRDYLLPKLLSGEVEVPAAEAVVEDGPAGSEVAGYGRPALF